MFLAPWGLTKLKKYFFGWPRGVFLALCMTLKLHCGARTDTFAIWIIWWCPFATFGDLGAPVWQPWDLFVALDVRFDDFLSLCGVPWTPLTIFWEKP